MSEKTTKKEQAIELAGKWRPARMIAKELGVSLRTVERWLKDYRDTLPPLATLTRQRLQMGMDQAENIDDAMRIASVARHDWDKKVELSGGVKLDVVEIPGAVNAEADELEAIRAADDQE